MKATILLLITVLALGCTYKAAETVAIGKAKDAGEFPLLFNPNPKPIRVMPESVRPGENKFIEQHLNWDTTPRLQFRIDTTPVKRLFEWATTAGDDYPRWEEFGIYRDNYRVIKTVTRLSPLETLFEARIEGDTTINVYSIRHGHDTLVIPMLDIPMDRKVKVIVIGDRVYEVKEKPKRKIVDVLKPIIHEEQ